MLCSAVAPWGAGCVLPSGHLGDHLTEDQRIARAVAVIAWRKARDEFWTAVAQRAAARERAKVKETLHPVVLVPTQAQRAAGRLVDARDDQLPKSVRDLLPTLADALVRVTYAHALMPPKRGGEDWWDNHTVAVRVRRIDGCGWGCWSNGGWDGGQWASGGVLRTVGADEFACLARGVPHVVTPPAVCPACHKAVRVKKDGALYAHPCVVVSDASLDSQPRQLVGSAA